MFEMNAVDLPAILSRLTIRSRGGPVRATGDPLLNGWNVWPESAPTFIPGNRQYGGFKRTWERIATPIEMLSCSSPRGDWLHVEFWTLGRDKLLVKMYTDWN